MKSRGELNTEKRNEVSTSIDSMSIKDILQTINEEDSKIIDAVKIAIPKIEQTVKLYGKLNKKWRQGFLYRCRN